MTTCQCACALATAIGEDDGGVPTCWCSPTAAIGGWAHSAARASTQPNAVRPLISTGGRALQRRCCPTAAIGGWAHSTARANTQPQQLDRCHRRMGLQRHAPCATNDKNTNCHCAPRRLPSRIASYGPPHRWIAKTAGQLAPVQEWRSRAPRPLVECRHRARL